MADQQKDLVLPPNMFAFVLDNTKGNVSILNGPHKEPLSETDIPVIFDNETKKFVPTRILSDAQQKAIVAPEGWYVVLKNPAKENQHPTPGRRGDIAALEVGNKINIPGPVNFALYPMQMAKVIPGHRLAHNEYLLCRVYNGDAARTDIGVVEAAEPVELLEGEVASETTIVPEVVVKGTHKTGEQFIIRGSEVSFYIPPTGIEVIKNQMGEYVRQAVTLENLEYCMLKDENGEKRYVQGPAVVFPKPTERFILDGAGNAKFRAIELNENSGIYIRVIEEYDDKHKGDELFITGKEQAIYFPRKEHAIIKYGSKIIHYAIAIPKGEARYVLDRNTSEIAKLVGPKMFLPDPRKEVIVKRILTQEETELMFPGNKVALDHNAALKQMAEKTGTSRAGYYSEHVQATANGSSTGTPMTATTVTYSSTGDPDKMSDQEFDSFFKQKTKPRSAATLRGKLPSGVGEFADEMSRPSTYTKPREITLDTKYDGAVTVEVWNNYAVQIIDKEGKREIVEGPATILLDYDQTMGSLYLSRGVPKSEKNRLKTAFLKVHDNHVRDIVVAETSDFCEVQMELSYLINFEGDKSKWFDANNYVQLCTDRCRAMIRNTVSKIGIKDFYANSADILRDLLLGQAGDDSRKGRVFPENGMRLYDLEVLNVDILNAELEQHLINNTRELVQSQLELTLKRDRLFTLRQIKELEKEGRELEEASAKHEHELKLALLERQKMASITRAAAEDELEKTKIKNDFENETAKKELEGIKLSVEEMTVAQKLKFEQERQALKEKMLTLESDTRVKEIEAVQKDLIASLKGLEEAGKLEAVMRALPIAILENKSAGNALIDLLEGTPLASVASRLRTAIPESTK